MDSNNDGTPDSEYGDESCIMGHSFRGYRHFNAYHKRSMNWITASGERILNASGKYRILATEQNSRRRDRYFGETQSLTFPIQGAENKNYYVSYRLKLDAYSTMLNVPNLISIHRGYTNGTFSNLIRTLRPSGSFIDSNGLKIKFLSAKSPYATVQTTLPQ
jgi:hypothetical protein